MSRYAEPTPRSGIRLRSPVLSSTGHDERRAARRDQLLAVVNGRRPGESLVNASVRIVGFNLWACAAREPRNRRGAEPDVVSVKRLMDLTGLRRWRVKRALDERGVQPLAEVPRFPGKTRGVYYPRDAACRALGVAP